MIWRKCQLDNTVLKATEAITLGKTERGFIEIGEGTLALPIKLGDQQRGYIFHGQGKLLLDAIVETEKGAVGKSVEKEIKESFLMLGDAKEIQQHLSTATNEDLAKVGYENQERFVAKAEDLYDRFLERMWVGHRCEEGLIFAFPNKASKLDILVVRDSKLVYKAIGMVFVSNKNKVVLKSSGEVVLLRDGKSFVIQK